MPQERWRESPTGTRGGCAVLVPVDDYREPLAPRAEVIRRIRARFAAIPSTVSLADELIAERRREAGAEVNG